MTNNYLSFSIYNDLYAIDINKVLEVLEKQELTRIPNAPAVIQGLLNFRGNIVPVYESRLKFNLPLRVDEEGYVIVIIELALEDRTCFVGAIVDKVHDVITLSDEEIKPVPPMSKEFNPEFIKGVAKLEDQFLMIFEVDKIYSSSEIENIKQITDQKPVKKKK